MRVPANWKAVEVPIPYRGSYSPASSVWLPQVMDPREYAAALRDARYVSQFGMVPAPSFTEEAFTYTSQPCFVFTRPDVDDPSGFSAATRRGIQLNSTHYAAFTTDVVPVSVIGMARWISESSTYDRPSWMIYQARRQPPRLLDSALTWQNITVRETIGTALTALANFTCYDAGVSQIQGARPLGIYLAEASTTTSGSLVQGGPAGNVVAGIAGWSSAGGYMVDIQVVFYLPSRGKRITKLVRQRASQLAMSESGIWHIAMSYSGSAYVGQVEEIAKVGPDMPQTVVDTGTGVLFCRAGIPYILTGRTIMPLVDASRSFLPMVSGVPWDDLVNGSYATWDPILMHYHVLLRRYSTNTTVAWLVYDLSGGPERTRIIVNDDYSPSAIGVRNQSGVSRFASCYVSGSQVVVRTHGIEPGSRTARWVTPWLAVSPGRRVSLKSIQFLGVGNGSSVTGTIEASDDGATVRQSVSFGPLTWSQDLAVGPDIADAYYYRFALDWGGTGLVQGIRLYYTETF